MRLDAETRSEPTDNRLHMTPTSRTHSQNAFSKGPLSIYAKHIEIDRSYSIKCQQFAAKFSISIARPRKRATCCECFFFLEGDASRFFGSPCANLSKSNKTSEKDPKWFSELQPTSFDRWLRAMFCGSSMDKKKIKAPATFD